MASHGHHERFQIVDLAFKEAQHDHLHAVGAIELRRDGGPATYRVVVPISFNTGTTDSVEAKRKTREHAREKLAQAMADILEAAEQFEP